MDLIASDKPDPQKDGPASSGTTFTINIGDVELTEAERQSIMSDVVQAALKRGKASKAALLSGLIFGRFGSFGSFGRVVAE